MAELFPGNFVNPQYATPEQLATQRAYAAELMKRSGQDVTRPTGAIANVLNAITSGLTRNSADTMQREAAARNSADLQALITQLQSGKVDPATAGRIYANPLASPEHRALVSQLITPQKVEDVVGRPGYSSPSAGIQPAPINASPGLPFQPGFRAAETAGSVSTTTPFPAPMPTPRPAVRSSPKVWGDKEAEAAGLYPPSPPAGGGPQAPASGPPAVAAPAAPGSRIPQLAAMGRDLDAEAARVKGGAEAEAKVILGDVTRAASAPETLKGLGIMRNTIETVGDKMTFGPTAKLSNEARRVIANYAPGLVDEKSLAGADAIEKLNLGLAGALSQSLGLNPSDIYRSVASVPGNEKSKAGTLALINMMEQAARNDQFVGTTIYQQNRGNLSAYQQARQSYYDAHPIINPITGNRVEIDAQKASQGGRGAYEQTATNPQTGERIGLRNGKWEPIK